MDHLFFLQDMATVMAFSAVIMIICRRFNLPVVLGYIIAGVLIGPHTPPYPLVKDLHSIYTLSELGIIFLLFSIGLEFSFSKLLKIGFVSLIAASFEIFLMIVIGYSLGRSFGWSEIDSIFLGAILSISSTTIIAKVLLDLKKIQEKFAQVILGILIVEDLLAIVIIAILSGLAVTGDITWDTALQSGLKVLAFVAGVIFFGMLTIPKLLRYLSKSHQEEAMLITTLGMCFGVAFLASKMGFSVALGAFLAGAIIAETEFAEKVVHQVASIRDMFTAIFFVSVGMLIHPSLLVEYWMPILIITCATIMAKVVSCSLGTFFSGYDSRTALQVGLGLAQIGEFSFIIAKLGESTNVTSSFLYPIAVSVSAITTLTTPFLMRNADPIITGIKKITPHPLKTFLELYESWIQSVGGMQIRSEKKILMLKSLQHYGVRLVIYLLAILMYVYGLAGIRSYWSLLEPNEVYWTFLILGVLPGCMGCVYTLDRILWESFFANITSLKKEQLLTQGIGKIVHHLLRFVMIVLVLFLFIPISGQFTFSLPVMGILCALTAILGFILWGAMSKLHDRIENSILGVFDPERRGDHQAEHKIHEDLVQLIRTQYPWEVETTDFLVPFQSCAINRKIQDLGLRTHTGATIVAIYRNDSSIPNPTAQEIILPGDVLLLMGTQQQIKDSIRFLTQTIKTESSPPESSHE